MRSLYPVIPFALALLVAGAVRAEGVSVTLDHAERLNVAGTAASVVVGNANVADVSVLDSHTLYILARNYGSTNIVVIDPLGRTIYSGDVTVVRPASSVSLYRGVARADFACAPACSEAPHVSAPTPPPAAAGGVTLPLGPPAAHP